MKKRAISMFLAVMMLLSMLPVTAMATDGGQDATAPGLYYCGLSLNDDDEWFVNYESAQSQWWCSPDSSQRGCFYYGTESAVKAGKGELLDADDLEFPAYLEVEEFEDDERGAPKYAYRVSCVRFENDKESTEISYTLDGETFTIHVESQLPVIGFYTGPQATKDTLIYEDEPFVVKKGQNNTIYICPGDPDGITTMTLDGWGGEVPANLFTVTSAADGSYLALTCNEGVNIPLQDIWADVSMEHQDGWGYERSVRLYLENGDPALYYTYLDREKGEDGRYWAENIADNGLDNRFTGIPGDNCIVMFYYGTARQIKAGKVDPIPAADLNLPGYIRMEEIDEDELDEDLDPGCAVELYFTRFAQSGEAKVIGYEDSAIPAPTVLPEVGFYTQSTASEEAYIYEGNPFEVTKENRTFYLCPIDTDTTTLMGIEEWDEVDPDIFDITTSSKDPDENNTEDGLYIKFRVKGGAALPDDTPWVEVEFKQTEGRNEWVNRWGVGLWMENGEPDLYYTRMRWEDIDDENGHWTLDVKGRKLENQWTGVPDQSSVVAFFYGKEGDIKAGKVEPIPMAQLSFPEYMKATALDQDELAEDVPFGSAFRLRINRFEQPGDSREITYLDSTLPVETCLPEVGFYTQSTASKDAYIYEGNPFKVTQEENTFYLCPSDPDNLRVMGICGWSDDVDPSIFELTSSSKDPDENNTEDGLYIKLQVKDGVAVPDRTMWVDVELAEKDGKDEWSDSYEDSARLSLKNGVPTLLYCTMDWDDVNQEWYVSENQWIGTDMSHGAGDEFPVQFYYGTEDSKVEVDAAQLTFPNGILETFTREGVTWVRVVGFDEEGVITYADGGAAAQMKVYARQPDFGFYSDSKASKANWLGEAVTVDKQNDTFFVVAEEDRTIEEIEGIFYDYDENVTDYFEVEISKNGRWAELSLKKGDDGEYLAPGGNYRMELAQEWGTRYLHFELVRNDLTQLDTPTDLVWHEEYGWEWDHENDCEKPVTRERMGAMGFKVGELVQNRFEVEIWSFADQNTTAKGAEVHNGGWRFGDMDHSEYFTVTDFIYAELPSGIYRFRVKAEGDGTKYRDSEWSAWSPAFVYEEPTAQLTAPDESDLTWTKWEGRYQAVWPAAMEDAAGYYEVNWFYENAENGEKERTGGSFDIPADRAWEDGSFREELFDEILEEHGNVPYFFQVRVIPEDITQYRVSPWSGFSPALDVQDVTDRVNEKLDDLMNPSDPSAPAQLTVQDVQNALENDTADLRTAMAADQGISGGTSSGTLELIQQLENTVADDVDQVVDAKNSAPKAIQDIADGVTMIGAALNLADKHPETGKTPTVTLELDAPKEGIVIPEQQHNAVQFSMKLNGAVDKDDKEQAGQQLIVPVVIDMPIPAGINPDFLVVLHKLWDGSVEQMWPHIYQKDNCWYARFVVDSFSDFALIDTLQFLVSSVSKTVGDDSFVIEVFGAGEGSEVTYTSSNEAVAQIDPVTGEVTINGAGTVTITATESAAGMQASYTITVASKAVSRPSSSSSSSSRSQVKAEQSENGKVTLSSTSPRKGTSVTVTVTPDTGYALASLTVTDRNGKAVVLKEKGEGEFTFTAPSGKMEVKALFVLNAFADVTADDWFYESVKYVYDNGIMAGNGDGTFGSAQELTRAMVAQVLFNLDENGYTGAANLFRDVAADQWYADAINWAAAEGVMNGYGNGLFGTMDSVTREQLAMTLYNYAVSNNYVVEGKVALEQYADSGDIAFWAVDAVKWAVANGILAADNGLLQPGMKASRAQVALALMNFCENCAK